MSVFVVLDVFHFSSFLRYITTSLYLLLSESLIGGSICTFATALVIEGLLRRVPDDSNDNTDLTFSLMTVPSCNRSRITFLPILLVLPFPNLCSNSDGSNSVKGLECTLWDSHPVDSTTFDGEVINCGSCGGR
jgi:hypothetical protein